MLDVYLHGHLGKTFGERFRLDVATAGEAIRLLDCNFPTFLETLSKGSYEVIRGDQIDGLRLDIEHVNSFRLGAADLHIVPVLEGAKNQGGVLKALAGVALVGAAVFMSGGALATPVAGGALGGLTYGNMAILGITAILLGASVALSSREKDKNKKDQSYSLGTPTNFSDQGNPVALIYGEPFAGANLISAGMDIENIGSYQG